MKYEMEKNEEEKIEIIRSPPVILKVLHGFGAGFTGDLRDSIHFVGEQELKLLYPVGRYIGVRDINTDKEMKVSMKCERIDDQLESITAMTMTSNRQCMAVAVRFRNDKSAYIFFYDLLQLHPLKRVGKVIHEGSPTDENGKCFISIAFSPEAKYLAVLTNLKDGHARIYEWKKEARVIATNSWLSELNKEAKANVYAEITKISIDPNNKDQVCLSGKFHLRIWRNQSNILKPLPPILGLDLSKDYTDHAWLEGNWLVGGTDKGELCFVYDNKQCIMETPAFGGLGEAVSCIYPFSKGLFVGGSTGQLSVWEQSEMTVKDIRKGGYTNDLCIKVNKCKVFTI